MGGSSELGCDARRNLVIAFTMNLGARSGGLGRRYSLDYSSTLFQSCQNISGGTLVSCLEL